MSGGGLSDGFVGVHIGAGQHSEARTRLYLDICAAACQAGVDVLREGGSALDAAERATLILEDAGETNAGYGSNLTESGTLEMDAGLMDGSTLLFGAVGAITEIKNPIRVARKLVDEQAKGLLPLGRVPPGFLVGEGARDWAIRHGIQTVNSEDLVSEKAAKLYKHYKKKLDAYKLSLEQNKRKKEDSSQLLSCKKLKTAQKLAISEHVRSNDGATKLVDGNSIDFDDTSLPPVYKVVQTDMPNQRHFPIPVSENSYPSSSLYGLHLAASQPHQLVHQQQSQQHHQHQQHLLQTQQPQPVRQPHQLQHLEHQQQQQQQRLQLPQQQLQQQHSNSTVERVCNKFSQDIPDAKAIADYDDKVHDTVGVVVLDRLGHVAASVSSGGIALKQSGRVGQASCYGCGCWAQRALNPNKSSVAVSTTGCGEHLVRTLLAKECGQGLANSSTPMESLQNIMKEKFAESEFLEGINEKLGGAICMQFDKKGGKGNFLWTHTTSSMGIGFQTTRENEATVKMSRLPKTSSNQGTTILVESVKFTTQPAIQ